MEFLITERGVVVAARIIECIAINPKINLLSGLSISDAATKKWSCGSGVLTLSGWNPFRR
ncbi:MAG: hypothetical protein V7695_02985 [Sulfitobacter sp.]